MAAVEQLDEQERERARPELDPEKLDALAAVLERSASWFPAPAEPESAPVSTSAPKSEPAASTAPPESRVRASSRPLGKKERRELERKQRLLSAQRANEERRERRRKRERLRAERLAARNQAAPAKLAAPKVSPRSASSEVVTPQHAPQQVRRVPWASIAILVFPLGAALRAARGGANELWNLVWISLPIAVVFAWLVRKR